MKILITGGAGFIGLNLALRLLKQGHRVYIADNLITSDETKLDALKGKKGWHFYKADISKRLPFTLVHEKFQQIYHLACPTGVPNLTKLAEEMMLASGWGTRNILELAKKNRARILFASSSEVYGEAQIFPQSESYTGNVDSIGVRSPYEEGKRFAEAFTMMYYRKYKLNTKIVRIFNTYGPWMSLSDTRVIPRFLTSALTNRPLTITGEGKQKRTFCYVDDLISGMINIMNDKSGEIVYNLGSDKEITILELAHTVLQLTKSGSRIKFTARPSHDHFRRLPDLTKARKGGFTIKTTLESGLVKTMDWLKERM